MIGLTDDGVTRLRQDPDEPRTRHQLIFPNRDDNIAECFLANNSHNPLNLMVLESCPEDGEDPHETPEPPNRRYLFFDSEVGDYWARAEYGTREMPEEEWIDDDE